MISAIVLSAGESARFGSPKALAPVYNTPIIRFLVDKLTKTALDKMIIVLGADYELIEPCLFKHKKIHIVYNKDYKFGQISSVQCGLREIPAKTDGFLILPVDCPFILPQSVDALIQEFIRTRSRVLIPTHQGRRGHPPVFGSDLKTDILNLPLSAKLSDILHNPSNAVTTFELQDPGITFSFNKPEELAEIKKKLRIN